METEYLYEIYAPVVYSVTSYGASVGPYKTEQPGVFITLEDTVKLFIPTFDVTTKLVITPIEWNNSLAQYGTDN